MQVISVTQALFKKQDDFHLALQTNHPDAWAAGQVHSRHGEVWNGPRS